MDWYPQVKNGSFVNEEVRTITESMFMDGGSSLQSQSLWQDDPLGKVFGKEHPGRVCGLGLRPCPFRVFDNTPRMNGMQWSSNDDSQMKEYVANLEKELVATKA